MPNAKPSDVPWNYHKVTNLATLPMHTRMHACTANTTQYVQALPLAAVACILQQLVMRFQLLTVRAFVQAQVRHRVQILAQPDPTFQTFDPNPNPTRKFFSETRI